VRPLAEARRALRDPQPFLRDEHALLFQQLHDEAERVRTTLAALAQVRGRLVGWRSPERAWCCSTSWQQRPPPCCCTRARCC
ncbi:MAG: hypothetical protein M3P31_07190, partial [Actinomycetota bacterium]|nr:hypothetical protein [Actinomycetota bacterium]